MASITTTDTAILYRGDVKTLRATFYETPGGDVVDATGVTVEIEHTSSGAKYGPFAPTRISEGLYEYEWTVPGAAPFGNYLVTWTGLLPTQTIPDSAYSNLIVTEQPIANLGCPWPVDPACQTEEWWALDERIRDRALAMASATLSRLTGYRVSNCPMTVRPYPARSTCYAIPFRGLDQIQPMQGYPTNPSGRPDIIRLPAPIGRVDQVKIDGVALAPTEYAVEGDCLVRLDGEPWPAEQDFTKADTEPGTFSVTYLNAYPVDGLGSYAVGVLALEMAKACLGGTKCRLPSTVTQLVRQGVTIEIPAGTFPDGQTGIREVDQYIGLWNPAGLRRTPAVLNVSSRAPRFRTL